MNIQFTQKSKHFVSTYHILFVGTTKIWTGVQTSFLAGSVSTAAGPPIATTAATTAAAATTTTRRFCAAAGMLLLLYCAKTGNLVS